MNIIYLKGRRKSSYNKYKYVFLSMEKLLVKAGNPYKIRSWQKKPFTLEMVKLLFFVF